MSSIDDGVELLARKDGSQYDAKERSSVHLNTRIRHSKLSCLPAAAGGRLCLPSLRCGVKCLLARKAGGRDGAGACNEGRFGAC
jgi:hypothetical protein